METCSKLPDNESILPRRNFIKTGALSALASMLGMEMVFSKYIPSGLIPLESLGDERLPELLKKHPELTILNDRPWNVETPAHLLDDKITPAEKMFIRNNGLIPRSIEPNTWALKFDGESIQEETEISLSDLKSNFKKYTYQLTLECGGNGRHEFSPPAKGNQWTTGAVSCGKWGGARLKDVLAEIGIKKDAVYIGYYGADTHLSGNKNKVVISRGVPIKKALENESLLAYELNDSPLPLANGFPLRLVFGGWPASTSGKWVNRISLRNRVHDGQKMGGQSYRVPCESVAPGDVVPDEKMCIIESMPVKSLITSPKSGAMIREGQSVELRGHAWAGDLKVIKMEISMDYGQTWKTAEVQPPANRLAWQHWMSKLKFSKKGYYEVWARATSENGKFQPMLVPGWNPRGYLNNACHRIAIKVRG
jgi:sulfite oxidase